MSQTTNAGGDERTPSARVSKALVAVLLSALLVASIAATALVSEDNREASPQTLIDPPTLVAMGDSYTAGVGVAPYDPTSTANACFRSQESYALRAASILNIDGSSVACGGATTAAFEASHQGEAPQLQRIGGADIVALTVGGNDVRGLQTLTENPTAALAADFVARFEAEQLAPLATTLDATYAKVRSAAPDAEVFVVGYPNLFPADRAEFQYCDGIRLPLGVAALGLPLENLHLINDRLNDVIAQAAERAGFTFVDVAPAFEGHDVCAELRLIWGTVDAPNPEGAFHPTGDGHRVMGDILTAAIRAAGIEGIDPPTLN